MATRARYYGFNPPFYVAGQHVLPIQVDDQLIKNDILQGLLTIPGERPHRPTFGTNIRAIVFDNVHEEDQITLENQIRAHLQTHEDRVNVNNVSVVKESDVVTITVDVSPNGEPLKSYLISLVATRDGGISIQG